MKKNNILKLIIFAIIMMVILIIILINYKSENKDTNNYSKVYIDDNIQIKEKYDCNEFQFITVTAEDLISMYLNKYRSYLLTEPEQAYQLLNKEYREKKFIDLEGYKRYIADNMNEIYNATIKTYKMEEKGNKTTYICLDQNGKYYIFNENAVMDFDIILDTYTVDLPEFVEKYNSTNEQGKVALNINKFFQALNEKDYKYAYNCLADSYKNNYFRTQEEFENYARENFYTNSSVSYKQFDIQQDVYTYYVVLTNKETGEQMNKTFIMQLGEGTEFVLSFNR